MQYRAFGLEGGFELGYPLGLMAAGGLLPFSVVPLPLGVALGQVVVLPDTSAPVQRAYGNLGAARRRYRHNPESRRAHANLTSANMLWWRTELIRSAALVNLLAQASLLAVSLWALAYHQDLIPPPIAIILAVGGLLLLAWSAIAVFNFRQHPSLRDPADNSRDKNG